MSSTTSITTEPATTEQELSKQTAGDNPVVEKEQKIEASVEKKTEEAEAPENVDADKPSAEAEKSDEGVDKAKAEGDSTESKPVESVDGAVEAKTHETDKVDSSSDPSNETNGNSTADGEKVSDDQVNGESKVEDQPAEDHANGICKRKLVDNANEAAEVAEAGDNTENATKKAKVVGDEDNSKVLEETAA